MDKIGRLKTPFSDYGIIALQVGDEVDFSGTVCTARDVVCERLCDHIESAASLPFDLRGAVFCFFAHDGHDGRAYNN